MIDKIIFADTCEDRLSDVLLDEHIEFICAGNGYSRNMELLNYYMKQSAKRNFSLVTNCLIMWDNRTLRDLVGGDMDKYCIYLHRKPIPIQQLTDKNITSANNLEKMYINGVFNLGGNNE